MTYDASNRKDIRRAEKAADELATTRANFLNAAMSTPQGRAWFYHFLSDCHIFADAFTGNALSEAFLKGERNIGLRIFAEISATCPEQYLQMIKEENARIALFTARESAADAAKRATDDTSDIDYTAPDPYANGADLH